MKKVTKKNRAKTKNSEGPPMYLEMSKLQNAFSIPLDRVQKQAKFFYGYTLTETEMAKFRICMTDNEAVNPLLEAAINTALLVIINPRKCNWDLVLREGRDEMKKKLKYGKAELKNMGALDISAKGNI